VNERRIFYELFGMEVINNQAMKGEQPEFEITKSAYRLQTFFTNGDYLIAYAGEDPAQSNSA
jgi:hypothetical protein